MACHRGRLLQTEQVEQGRRDDAVTVIDHLRMLDGRRVARVADIGGPRLDVPGLDPMTVSRDALALRPGDSLAILNRWLCQ